MMSAPPSRAVSRPRFTYDIDLRRSVPAWVDRTIATSRVVASVRFDNLTRRYQVTVLRDGRIEHTKVTDDEEAVRHEVAVFQRLPLFSSRVLEPNAEYYVRVRARTQAAQRDVPAAVRDRRRGGERDIHVSPQGVADAGASNDRHGRQRN